MVCSCLLPSVLSSLRMRGKQHLASEAPSIKRKSHSELIVIKMGLLHLPQMVPRARRMTLWIYLQQISLTSNGLFARYYYPLNIPYT